MSRAPVAPPRPSPPSSERSGAFETKFFLGALAVHGVFLFIAWRTPEPKYDFEVDKPLDVVEIELPKQIEKEDVPSEVARIAVPGAVAERPSDLRPDTRDARPSTGRAPVETGAVDPGTTPPTETGPTPPANEYEDAPPGANTWTMPGAPGGLKAYALPGVLADTGPAPAAPTAAPAAKKVDRDKANEILSADIREKDKKLGLNLPAAGTVASFVRSAVWGSDVPTEARAAIQVSVGANGKIQSVRVLSQSGGSSAAWEAVAASVKAGLAAQPLKMGGDYAKGAIITINVQSKMQMPSGNKSGDPVSLGITKSGPGGSFDLADIGAKPIRQILVPFSVVPVK